MRKISVILPIFSILAAALICKEALRSTDPYGRILRIYCVIALILAAVTVIFGFLSYKTGKRGFLLPLAAATGLLLLILIFRNNLFEFAIEIIRPIGPGGLVEGYDP